MSGRMKSNNEKRFYALAWPHMYPVIRTAQCLTHSVADAEDLAQVTMAKHSRRSTHSARVPKSSHG
jgi:hypothetical protein